MNAPLVRTTILASCLLASAARAQTITSIGSLGSPANSSSSALAVSADGSTAVGYSVSAGVYRAVRWRSTTGLEVLGTIPAGLRYFGYAVNQDGSTAAGVCVVSGAGHACRWGADGAMADLGNLPSTNVAMGFAISGDGLTVGGGPSTGGVGHAFIATTIGGIVDLGTLPGAPADATSALFALDQSGSTGAGFSGTSGGSRAIRWESETNTMTDLGVLPGGTTSEANAISQNGGFIAGTCVLPGGARAFRWSAGTGMQDLGVASGRGTSIANGISGDGLVVVGNDEGSAVFWTPSLGMVDLRTYLIGRGVNMTGWSTLTAAYGVSSDGRTIVGEGRFNGPVRGFVVTGLPSFACRADFNASGSATVQDIFDFLEAYFASDPRADFNQGGGITVQDIFDYLESYFAGCD